MKKIVILPIAVICFFSSVFGQQQTVKINTCTDETVAKISSRGIKIGDKMDDVLGLLTSSSEEKQKMRQSRSGVEQKNIGYLEFFGASPSPELKTAGARFDGISDYSFSFLDEHLVEFNVRYVKPKWKDNRQFASKMSEFFGLPAIDAWIDSGGFTLQCEHYSIYTQMSRDGQPGGYLRVSDSRLRNILAERKAKYEEDQRNADLRTFKP